jgi:hypothetical protein
MRANRQGTLVPAGRNRHRWATQQLAPGASVVLDADLRLMAIDRSDETALETWPTVLPELSRPAIDVDLGTKSNRADSGRFHSTTCCAWVS